MKKNKAGDAVVIHISEPERHLYQGYKGGHFNQRTNYPGKCLSAVDAQYANGNGNGSFKIIAGCSKCDCGIGGIVGIVSQ